VALRDVLLAGANASVLLFVVSSTLGVGLRLTVRQISMPLRDVRLVTLSLVANFALIPIGAIAIAKLTGLDEPLSVGLLLCSVAAGAPFLIKLADFSATRRSSS
jgi:BASS family bile acid:Na+ symporter